MEFLFNLAQLKTLKFWMESKIRPCFRKHNLHLWVTQSKVRELVQTNQDTGTTEKEEYMIETFTFYTLN